jgi:hypothetical protein
MLLVSDLVAKGLHRRENPRWGSEAYGFEKLCASQKMLTIEQTSALTKSK